MDRYKLCPHCGEKNEPNSIECVNCEEDLTSVKITDTKASENQNQTVERKQLDKMVKICDCGEKNPPNARKCKKCNVDISRIFPVPDSDEEKKKYMFESLDGLYCFEINKGISVVGRENLMKDYLSTKNYVSRKHAEIKLENEELRVKNFGVNFTFINNKQIDNDEFVLLNDNDVVSFGDYEVEGSMSDDAAYFRVKIN